jgi:hypothetical protein
MVFSFTWAAQELVKYRPFLPGFLSNLDNTSQADHPTCDLVSLQQNFNVSKILLRDGNILIILLIC